jgi:hypothetical protein
VILFISASPIATAKADSTTSLDTVDGGTTSLDTVDGDIATLTHPASHVGAPSTKDAISQEDIDAFLADISDSESEELASITKNVEINNEKETKKVTQSSVGDEINQDEIDDFFADCSDTDDDIPIMNIVDNLGGQDSANGKSEVTKKTSDETTKKVAAAAGSSPTPAEETLEGIICLLQKNTLHKIHTFLSSSSSLWLLCMYM